MKVTLLTFYLLLSVLSNAQQPVFMPSGAKWHYSFDNYQAGLWVIVQLNKTAEYTHDTILDNESVKILRHPQFSRGSCGCQTSITFIKQHGDTIFMKNSCVQDWQILYNFATPVDQEWMILGTSGSNIAYTVKVNNVQTVAISGMSLKQLNVSITDLAAMPGTLSYTETITERIGSTYIFLSKRDNCDGHNFKSLLCYADNSFPLYQASSLSCDYTTVGIEKHSQNINLLIHPNPAMDNITIKTTMPVKEGNIVITDVSGREVQRYKTEPINNETKINVSQLQQGIYFLQLSNDGQLITREKFIKE